MNKIKQASFAMLREKAIARHGENVRFGHFVECVDIGCDAAQCGNNVKRLPAMSFTLATIESVTSGNL